MSGFRDARRPRPVTGATALTLAALLAVVYAALAAGSLAVAQLSGLAAPVWPAAGVAVVFALTWGWRVLPGAVVGSAVVNSVLLAGAGESDRTIAVVSVGVGVGAALQAGIGAALVRRAVGARLRLTAPREILLALLLAGPVACVVNPTVGVLAQVWAGVLSPDQALVGWLTWWAGDAIGVIVFAPIALMLLPGADRDWAGRRWKVAVPSLLIVTSLTFALVQFAALERDRIEVEVAQLGAEAAADLRATLLRHEEVLEGIRGLLLSSSEVTAEEFEVFTTTSLSRHPSLQALSWNPVVPQADLADFVERHRAQSGLEGFTVTERGPAGDFVPASTRAEHVVIAYIEPRSENGAALGYDIASDPVRAQAIAAARDSGRITGTAPIDLVQNVGSETGMLALLPVYDQLGGDGVPSTLEARREQLRGFSVGVYRLQAMLDETFAASQWADVDIRLADATDADGSVVISAKPASSGPTIDEISRALPGVTVPLDVYGRDWLLQVTPTTGPLAQPNAPLTPALLVLAVLLVFLLEAFLLLLTGLEHEARRDADASSFEANHDALTGLANRRAFMRSLAERLSGADGPPTRDVLLFCDLDRFKRVNDTGGHEAGDRMLAAVAAAVAGSVRARDIVARIGGDEFAVILVDCPLERALQIADAIVDAVQEVHVAAGGTDHTVGISIGVTVLDAAEAVSVDTVMSRADEACYAAKRGESDQGRVVVASAR